MSCHLLDVWAMTYMHHESEMIGDREWIAWDDYFAHIFSKGGPALTVEEWENLSYGFDQHFWTHEGNRIFEK